MRARGDSIALIHVLADLAGRPVADDESLLILDRARTLSAQRANEIWSQHRRSPATVSMRDYLAMTLRFLDQGTTRDRSSARAGHLTRGLDVERC